MNLEDGKTAFLNTDEGYLRLVEVATGRELARFEGPDPYVGQSAMSPHGTKLVEPQKEGIRVWDLRLIRSELVKLQGQRSLNRCSGKNFQQEVLVPTTTAAFHGEAVSAGMLLQQR